MLGIHKLQDAAALRQSVKAACAEARLAEQSGAIKYDRLDPVSGGVTDTRVDCDVDSMTNDAVATSTAVGCTDMTSCIPVKPDLHLGASAGHLLAVLSSSHSHSDTRASIADSLPRYFFIDAWRSVDSHQNNM